LSSKYSDAISECSLLCQNHGEYPQLFLKYFYESEGKLREKIESKCIESIYIRFWAWYFYKYGKLLLFTIVPNWQILGLGSSWKFGVRILTACGDKIFE
jgi:hypothetical protein